MFECHEGSVAIIVKKLQNFIGVVNENFALFISCCKDLFSRATKCTELLNVSVPKGDYTCVRGTRVRISTELVAISLHLLGHILDQFGAIGDIA